MDNDIPVIQKPTKQSPATAQPDYRFRVLSGHAQMGELISQWSRYPDSRPSDLPAFKAQAAGVGIVLEIGADVTDLQMFDMPNDHRAIVYIPPIELIDDELPPGKFPLPAFYRSAFPCDDQITDKQAFRMSRIGEYTTQKCY